MVTKLDIEYGKLFIAELGIAQAEVDECSDAPEISSVGFRVGSDCIFIYKNNWKKFMELINEVDKEMN